MADKKKVSLSDTHIKRVGSKQKESFTSLRKTAPEAGRRTTKLPQQLTEADDAFQCWLKAKMDQQNELRRQREQEERVRRELESERERIRAEAALLNRKIWLKKKAEEKRREEMKKKKLLEEEEFKRKAREAECKERVRVWMELAKSKPKPTRSNMGLASLVCNNVRPMNRIPWKNIIECGAD